MADVLCMELAALSPDAERFDAKTTVLIENVTHHIGEEEQDWFGEGARGPRPQTAAGTRHSIWSRRAPGRPRSPAQPSAEKKVVDAVIS